MSELTGPNGWPDTQEKIIKQQQLGVEKFQLIYEELKNENGDDLEAIKKAV